MSENNINIFDGNPSVELDHRPFFSIVVACYNPSVYLERLLKSIEKQDMNDNIEVILSDDHSTEDYQVFVEKFSDRLCIRQIQTDYNFGPGNTREKGCTIVTGEWLTFADQDDCFEPDSPLSVFDDTLFYYDGKAFDLRNGLARKLDGMHFKQVVARYGDSYIISDIGMQENFEKIPAEKLQ